MSIRYLTAILSLLLLPAVEALAGSDRANREECVVKCHEAAALVTAKGLETAAEAIADPQGAFVWKDSYVFLMDFSGKMLAHPVKPELTKEDHLLLMTDPTDKAIFVHFVNLARKVGHGWVKYMWPRPGKNTPSVKLSYIYRVPGQDLFVGAGVYEGGMMY